MKMDEWLAEVERLRRRQPEGFSCAELRTEKGWGRNKAEKFIKDGIALGVLIYSGDRKSANMAGRICYVPVYKLVKK